MPKNTPDFQSMSLDELTSHKTSLKEQIDALHEEARLAGEVQAKLIEEEHITRARESMQAWADENGKTLEQAIEYWEGRLTATGDKGRWVQSLLLQGKPGKVSF